MKIVSGGIALLMAFSLAACGDSDASPPAVSLTLTSSESAAAEWLGRAYSEGHASDMFFEGFWVFDAVIFENDEAWQCIFEGVVGDLRRPETQGTLDDLVDLSMVEPAFPTSHRPEIEAILASLPESERLRLGHQVIAVAQQCGDLRLGLFGGGGPVAVCIYDRTSGDQRAQLVASTMGAVYPDHYEWTPEVEAIAKDCYDEIAGAYEEGGTIDWVEELDQRAWEGVATTTTIGSSPAESEGSDTPIESRATPATEWIGLEYDDEMDYELEEVFRVDVRTTPPTRIDLYGGWTAWSFYGEEFTIVENYFESGMDPETAGTRLLFMIQHTSEATSIVLDAIQVTQELNERLLECNSAEAASVLALARGIQSDSGTEFHVIDAWQLSVEDGFESTSPISVTCS